MADRGDMRRAWISEDIEEDWGGRTEIATARFSARIEDATLPEGLELAPRGLRLADAVRWARARADAVVLELHDADGVKLYSAGVKRATGFRPRLLEWEDHKRPLRRRRTPFRFQAARFGWSGRSVGSSSWPALFSVDGSGPLAAAVYSAAARQA